MNKNLPVKIFNSHIYNFSNYKLPSKIDITSHWLVRFINERKLFTHHKSTVSIFGVNGEKFAISLNRSKYKIFFTIENVHVILSPWKKYEDLLVEDKKINLSLGYDFINHPKYLRFPFWLMTNFDPNDGYDEIRKKCESITRDATTISPRSEFCAFICRDDYFGDRKFFADEVEKISPIKFAGKFRHNDDSLLQMYEDNKHQYLKYFRFNLCPENSNNKGYVTEKVFDAIKAGCIPIYWGSGNAPELEILNQKRIIFLELNGTNSKALEKIKHLEADFKAYEEFKKLPVFLPDAPDKIFSYINTLEKKLIEIFNT